MTDTDQRCPGADDPEERCPRHPKECTCWQVDLNHPTVGANPMTIETELTAVKVKALEWREDWGGSLEDIPEWRAKMPWGSITVSVAGYRDASGNKYERHSDVPEELRHQLMADAQADYEKRVISATIAATEIVKDAARYRYLRDNCSCHYPMTHEQPAEWSIGWEFQQSTPLEAYGSFDKWIDADIEAMRQRQAELDAEDADDEFVPPVSALTLKDDPGNGADGEAERSLDELTQHLDLTAAAKRIFEVFCGGPVDWSRHVLNDADDNIFASGDWAQALRYAEAALASSRKRSEADG